MRIFNRNLLKTRRNRAAKKIAEHDFLLQAIAEDINSRLDDTSRKFPEVLDLGCHTGQLAGLLANRDGIDTIMQADISFAMVKQAKGLRVVADSEFLPFAAGAFDLIVSALELHSVNDLPGALIQLSNILKPDGVIIASLFGGKTLHELRQVMLEAEVSAGQGVSPHVFPFADIKDLGALLQRAGFTMPVVDSYELTVSYADVFSLMHDLRYMAETNILLTSGKNYIRKAVLAYINQLYQQKFSDQEGRLIVTFEILTLTAMARTK